MNFPSIPLSSGTLTLVLIVALAVATVIILIVTSKQRKRDNDKFLSENPQTAKVYLSTRFIEKHETARLLAVNGGPPRLFSEGTKSGFYAPPGKTEVDLEYSYFRAKTLSKSKMTHEELDLAPGKSYVLGFALKKGTLIFEEYEEK